MILIILTAKVVLFLVVFVGHSVLNTTAGKVLNEFLIKLCGGVEQGYVNYPLQFSSHPLKSSRST